MGGKLFKEETIETPCLEHIFVWNWNVGTVEIRSEIVWNFRDVALEKDGEDRLDRSWRKGRSVTRNKGEEECRTYSK